MASALHVSAPVAPARSRAGGLSLMPPGSGRGIRLAALQVPLATKLVGANLAVVVMLIVAWIGSGAAVTGPVMATIAGALVLHAGLATLALRPIRDLEATAGRVWDGDLRARVERSIVADNEVLRVGSMFNILLDGLAADRERMRALVVEVIAAGDRERAVLARQLHETTAQHLAALLFQLSAIARDSSDLTLARRLREARDATEGILEEVRLLSQSVHSGVLDDLGLEAALRKLARESSHGNGIDIDVNSTAAPSRLPSRIEVVLFRIAQEAVRNAVLHGSPRRIRLVLGADTSVARLEVHDDGRGFDLAAVARRRDGAGLVTMRERLALFGGTLDIKTAPGSGTTISATVPLAPDLGTVHLEAP